MRTAERDSKNNFGARGKEAEEVPGKFSNQAQPAGGVLASARTANPKRSGLFLAALSGVALALSFPRAGLSFLAWAALAPLLFALEKARNRKEAAAFGYAAGLVFFLVSVNWLRHVTSFGWLFVSFFFAAFFALFSAAVKILLGREAKIPGALRPWRLLFLVPALWVSAELLRTILPVFGFGWNLAGYTQAANTEILQAASVAGVFGVSFLVALAGTAAFLFLRTIFPLNSRKKKGEIISAALAVLLAASAVFGAYVFGKGRLEAAEPRAEKIRVSVVQGNIEQHLKWLASYKRPTIEKYRTLTKLAAYDRPDLVVWPEAAHPGYVNLELENEGISDFAEELGVPLLFGGPYYVSRETAFNSAFLFGADGEVKERYDKLRLVPFGEYVPFKRALFFVEKIAYSLGTSNFSAGRNLTVFNLAEAAHTENAARDIKFSVLLCFENAFPFFVRSFALGGADFLVEMTNDAWFKKSGAPYQHLEVSVFRAVETGLPLVQAANTGVSAFVDSYGRVTGKITGKDGRDIFVTGKITEQIAVGGVGTFYLTFGYLFSFLCLLISTVCLALKC